MKVNSYKENTRPFNHYIILGKTIDGVPTFDNDTSSLQRYFELGWEVVGSRIDIIEDINENKLHPNTVLVTTEDRTFLYSKFWPNVISWEEFCNLPTEQEKTVEDWVELKAIQRRDHEGNHNFGFKFNKLYDFINEDGEYAKKEQMFEDLHNGFDFSSVSVKPKKPFVVLSLRQRKHNSARNSPFSYYEKLIKMLRQEGIEDIYATGYGNEAFYGFIKETNLKYVPSLRDFTYLIKHKKCIGHIGELSGPVILSVMAADTKVIFFDPRNHSTENNPVLAGKCIRWATKGVHPLYAGHIDEYFSKIKFLLTGQK